MSWFNKHSFQWQMYWPAWYRFSYNKDRFDYDAGFYVIILCIGPLQMRWYD